MTASATLLDPSRIPALAADDAAVVERQPAEAGLEIAVALEAQAKGGEAVVSGDIAMAYNRVARAVRQTIMLQSRLIEQRREQREGRAQRRAAAGASAARLLRGVIDDEGPDAVPDAEHAERLAAEAAERLRQEDFGELLSRPFLSPDWLRLAEDCFAAEAALSGRTDGPPADEPYRGPLKVQWLPPAPGRLPDSS
jgi:hypothetical protein